MWLICSSICIYQSKLYKVCFQLDMAYGNVEDEDRKTAFRAVDTGGKGCVETQNFYFWMKYETYPVIVYLLNKTWVTKNR